MTDSTERNKQLIRHFVETVNRQDWDGLSGLVAPDFQRHSDAAGRPTPSRKALIEFLREEAGLFPDTRETIEDMIAEGDKVAMRHRFSATKSATGERISACYIAIYHIQNGRIAEAWAE